ncbi:MAG: DNA methyltransferase [Planctomycetota bacterium]|nr:DNA methyltransferase [Planctomycetota bacterium]
MRPKFDKDGIVLYQGDCLKVMSGLAPLSVDTIITDPPYGLEFMGQAWDKLDWQFSAGFGKPGIGQRNTKWPRFSPNSPFGTANPTCGLCGGRLRGKKKCRCETPRWKPLRQKNGNSRALQSLPDAHRAIQEWHRRWAVEALRVAKPGAFLLAFGGTRTFHRLACALEEAGWQIRDCLMWLYGSGFPKSLDIAKAIDKAAGAERETTGISSGPNNSRYKGERYSKRRPTRFGEVQDQPALTAPVSPAAKKWHGWGTGLKPAWEPIIVAMKPLDGTFARNALKHGVAGLNIDRARIGSEVIVINRYEDVDNKGTFTRPGDASSTHAGELFRRFQSPGRWPANVLLSHHPACEYVGHEQLNSNGHYPSERGVGGIGASGHGGQTGLVEQHTIGEIVESWRCHSHCPIAMLDEQSGLLRTGGAPRRRFSPKTDNAYGKYGMDCPPGIGGSVGGASRFFYCAKASKTQRDFGLPTGMTNSHPTIKPLKLMEYLCALTNTPRGGIILDPFAGSGSTLIAARNAGRKCIGIEINPRYIKIAEARLTNAIRQKKRREVMPNTSKR